MGVIARGTAAICRLRGMEATAPGMEVIARGRAATCRDRKCYPSGNTKQWFKLSVAPRESGPTPLTPISQLMRGDRSRKGADRSRKGGDLSGRRLVV